jgi:hypothetical protein
MSKIEKSIWSFNVPKELLYVNRLTVIVYTIVR